MATRKRELISPRGDKRFVRRDAKGRITESDDVGRSLAQDRRRKAKAVAKPGQGDKGDRPTSATPTRKTAMKKTAARKGTASKSSTRSTPAKKAAKKAGSARATARKAATPKRATRAGGASRTPNAIQLLKADHVTVRGLLTQLEQTTSRGAKTRQELLARIRREIEVHTTIEEEIFYPAFKAAGQRQDDDKQYFEAMEEHRAAGELVLPDLLATDPSSECFGGRAKVLKELIEHHAQEEEREMFPRARELLSAEELNALGERMAARKQALLAQPAPPKTIAGRVLSAVVDAITPDQPAAAGDEDALVRSAASRKASGDGAADSSSRSGR
jgi:hemerythrin superfamily protein